MKIAVFIKSTTFHKGYGGLETQNRSLCEGLAAKGHSVIVFSPTRELSPHTETQNHVTYVFVPSVYGTTNQLFSSNGWYKLSYKYFQELHASEKFDLILGQSSAALGIIKNKHSLGLPIISIAHGSTLSELNTRLSNIGNIPSIIKLIPDIFFTLYNFFFRQRQFIHGSDKVICVSNYVKSALIEECIADSNKFVVIHNGVDASKFTGITPVGDRSGPVKVLWVGQVIKEKGADLITKFVSDFQSKKIELIIAGDGNYLPVVKSDLRNANLENVVSLVGKKTFDELIDLYTQSDIFIFPTKRYEGFPMVLVEAMLAGLPVIAFDKGGTSDAVIDNKTGYLIPSSEITTFVKKIKTLAEDASLRKQLGNNGREIALKSFTLDNMINMYEKVLSEVLKI